MKQLRPYQVKTVEILANGGLNASGMGAGKTLTSVEICRHITPRNGRGPRIVVVAPIVTARQWERAFTEQFPSLDEKGLIHIVGSPLKDPDTWALMTKKAPGVFILGWEVMHGSVPEELRRAGSQGKNANRKSPEVTQDAVRKAIAKGYVPPWTRTGVWDLLILDEVHRASNRKGVPHHVLKFIRAERRLALSATPGGNHPKGLWAVLNLLWPERYSNFWDWATRHFHIESKVIDRRGTTKPVIGDELRPGGVWRDIPAVVRYETEEVYEQLPPVIDRSWTVPMTPEQEEQYRDFEEQSLAWLSDQPVAAPLPIEQRIRLRQAALGTLKAGETVRTVSYRLTKPEKEILAAWAKYQMEHPKATDLQPGFICDYNEGLSRGARHLLTSQFQRLLMKQAKLKEGVEFETVIDDLDISFEEGAEHPKIKAIQEILSDLPEGEPLVVWTHSAKWARMATKKLGAKAVSWTSSTTEAKRRKIEAGFGAEWQVLVAQLQSLSTGVDWLKDACRCEVIASCTEDEVMNEQAEGRLHRPGQKSPVQRWRLITENSIDSEVYLGNLEKRARMKSIYQSSEKPDAA